MLVAPVQHLPPPHLPLAPLPWVPDWEGEVEVPRTLNHPLPFSFFSRVLPSSAWLHPAHPGMLLRMFCAFHGVVFLARPTPSALQSSLSRMRSGGEDSASLFPPGLVFLHTRDSEGAVYILSRRHTGGLNAVNRSFQIRSSMMGNALVEPSSPLAPGSPAAAGAFAGGRGRGVMGRGGLSVSGAAGAEVRAPGLTMEVPAGSEGGRGRGRGRGRDADSSGSEAPPGAGPSNAQASFLQRAVGSTPFDSMGAADGAHDEGNQAQDESGVTDATMDLEELGVCVHLHPVLPRIPLLTD